MGHSEQRSLTATRQLWIMTRN